MAAMLSTNTIQVACQRGPDIRIFPAKLAHDFWIRPNLPCSFRTPGNI